MRKILSDLQRIQKAQNPRGLSPKMQNAIDRAAAYVDRIRISDPARHEQQARDAADKRRAAQGDYESSTPQNRNMMNG